MKRLLIGLFCLPLICYTIVALWGLIFIIFSNHDQCIDWLVGMTNQAELRDLIQEKLSFNTFILVKYLSLLGLTLSGILVGLIIYNRRRLYQFCSSVIEAINTSFSKKTIGLSKVVLLLLCFHLVKQVYLIVTYSISYDEAWTYLHFSDSHLFLLFFSPNNNHIVYSFFSYITNLFSDGLIAIRLPVLLGSFIFLGVFIRINRALFKRMDTLIAFTLIICLPAIHFYGFLGRGYVFQMIVCMCSFGVILKAIRPNEPLGWRFVFLAGLMNAWGLWALPTHLFFILIEFVFICFVSRTRERFKAGMFTLFFPILASCLLLPSWWIIHLTTSSSFYELSNSTQSTNWWDYINRVSDWLFYGGGRGKIVFPFVATFLFFTTCILIYQRSKKESIVYRAVLFSLLVCLSPFVISAILPVYMPYRIWVYTSPFYIILLVGILSFYPSIRTSIKYVGTCMLSLFFLWISVKHYFINWSAAIDKEAKVISQQMMQEKIDTCYLFSNYDQPLIQYYHSIEGVDLTLYMRSPNSQYYRKLSDTFVPPYIIYDIDDYVGNKRETEFLYNNYRDTIYSNERLVLMRRTSF